TRKAGISMSVTINPIPPLSKTSLPSSPLPRPSGKNGDLAEAMAPHVVRSRRWPSLIWKLGLGGAAIGLLAWGGYAKFLASNGSEIVDITGTVKRANLPITVTERGELESSSTTDVRCEIEGYQNKLATILPEGTHVKKGDVVVTFDTDQLKKAYDDQQV